MPSFQALTVDDRAATPVAHTFNPRSSKDGVSKVVEAGSIPAGEKAFSLSLRETGDKYKFRLKFVNPVVVTETINGVNVPSVARTAYVDAEFTFDAKSSEQERKDTVGMFANSLLASKVLVNDSVTKLETVW